MDVVKIFQMNGGVGATSYAKNSFLQKRASDVVKHITMKTLEELYVEKIPDSIGIADLGCSSGHNSLSTIREMVEVIKITSSKICKPVTEIKIHLNDLPTNDFNVIFSVLPEFYKELGQEKDDNAPSTYVAAYPGSFYGRLFPNKSLHFVYSSYSLHWLSKVPQGLYDEQGKCINKSAMYISEHSPPQVSQAYYKQFQEDMSLFFKSRAEELVDGGKMVLILLGRIGANHVDRGHYLLWELLAQSFTILVTQGKVEEEKLESYNMHFYAPSIKEVEEEVIREGSFEIERLEMFEIDTKIKDGLSYGKTVALTVRAIQESAIKHHFGDQIIDNLFEHFERLLDDEISKQEIKKMTLVAVLRKKISKNM